MTDSNNTKPTKRRSVPQMYGDLTHWGLIEADALSLLQQMPDASVDAVVTDPPYALAFGGKHWDGAGENRYLADPDGFQAFTETWAHEVKRVLKPGGYVAAFCAPRTFHRLVAGAEMAGLEVRDQLLWLFASGMPKSRRFPGDLGTALKPAFEPILLARAPLGRNAHGKRLTISQNLEVHGTGAMNIGSTRIPRRGRARGTDGYWPSHITTSHHFCCRRERCHQECPVSRIDRLCPQGRESLSRLFYAAKASRQERDAGCERLPAVNAPVFVGKTTRPRRNSHSTVKPIDLMRWIIRLVVPVGGVVLDPFTGSGSTGCAAVMENRQFVGIEREAEYLPIARARLAHWTARAIEMDAADGDEQ